MQYILIYIYIYIYLSICIYIYLYSIYLYISISIYIYWKKTRVGQWHAFFLKERNVLHSFAFFCKRTLRTLRSFTFFAKECCILWVLLRSLQRTLPSLRSFRLLRKEPKRMHRSFGSHKSPKIWEKKRKRRLRSLKEPKRTMCSERKRTPCPTLHWRQGEACKDKIALGKTLCSVIPRLIQLCAVSLCLELDYTRVGHAFFSKERGVLAFFCIL